MPGRRGRLARPLSQGLAHHLDLRRVRLGGGCGQAARPRGGPGRVGAGQCVDAVRRALRVPGLAGQERQRRQCRAQRPALRPAGGKGLLRAGRADRRRPGLAGRDGRAAQLGGLRGARRDLGGVRQLAKTLSRGLRDPSPARLRARLAQAEPQRRRRAGGRARQSPAAAAHRPARGRDRPRSTGEPAARHGCRPGDGQGGPGAVHRCLRQRSRGQGDAAQDRGGGRSRDLDHRHRGRFLHGRRQEAQRRRPRRRAAARRTR